MTVVFVTLETIYRLLKERIIGQRSLGIYISLKLFLDIGRWFPEKSVKLNSDLFKL